MCKNNEKCRSFHALLWTQFEGVTSNIFSFFRKHKHDLCAQLAHKCCWWMPQRVLYFPTPPELPTMGNFGLPTTVWGVTSAVSFSISCRDTVTFTAISNQWPAAQQSSFGPLGILGDSDVILRSVDTWPIGHTHWSSDPHSPLTGMASIELNCFINSQQYTQEWKPLFFLTCFSSITDDSSWTANCCL